MSSVAIRRGPLRRHFQRAIVAVAATAALLVGACGGSQSTPSAGRASSSRAVAPELGAARDAAGTAESSRSDGDGKTDSAKSKAADGSAAGEKADSLTGSGGPQYPDVPTSTPLRQGQVQNPNADTEPVPLTVESNSCARLGGTLRVTVISEADVDVAAIIAFRDNGAHESQSIGTTGPEGRLVLDVPVSADAPTGDARLMVAAGAPDGRRNSSSRAVTIVSAGASCP